MLRCWRSVAFARLRILSIPDRRLSGKKRRCNMPFAMMILTVVWNFIKGPVLHALLRTWSILAVLGFAALLFGQIRSYTIIKKSEINKIKVEERHTGFKEGYREATAKCPPAYTVQSGGTVNVDRTRTFGFSIGRFGIGAWYK